MSGWIDEYRAVRDAQGLIVQYDAGMIAVRGRDRFSWLQGMVSNDVRLLEAGAPSLQACLLDATGHVVSDLTLLSVPGAEPYLLMVLPRCNVSKVLAALDRLIIMEAVELEDMSDTVVCWSFQGPEAVAAFASDPDRIDLRRFNRSAPVPPPVAADHTGSGGYDIFFFARSVVPPDVCIVGSEAAHVLRVEAGIPQYGADLDEGVIALEAGLGPTHISLTKGCYVGQEIISRIDSRGHTNRALTGLVLRRGASLEAGTRLYSADGESAGREVGRITSVANESPAMGGRAIALAYIRHESREPGCTLTVGQNGSGIKAEVVPLPFYNRPAAQ